MTLKAKLQKKGANPLFVDWVEDRDYETAWSECPRGDWLLWILIRSVYPDRALLTAVAIDLADNVLPRFESLYPTDNSPRASIDAARAWLSNPSGTTNNNAREASRNTSLAAYRCKTLTAADASAKYAAHTAAYASDSVSCGIEVVYYACLNAYLAGGEHPVQADLVRKHFPQPPVWI